jgi:type IV secretion system protein TrbL
MSPTPSRRAAHPPVAASAGLGRAAGRSTGADGPDPSDPQHEPLPVRRRRRLLTPGSAVAAALLTAALGFYAGVRVEKGQLPASGSAASALTSSGRRAGGFAARAAAGGASTFAGAAGLFGGRGTAAGSGGAAGAAGATFGTVASVTGTSVDLTEPSGNTIKVTLSRATRVTKSESVSHHSIRPGDELVVQGVAGANGAIVAASVSDSGNRGGAAGATAGGAQTASGGSSAAGGGSSSTAGSSGVGALFSGG